MVVGGNLGALFMLLVVLKVADGNWAEFPLTETPTPVPISVSFPSLREPSDAAAELGRDFIVI